MNRKLLATIVTVITVLGLLLVSPIPAFADGGQQGEHHSNHDHAVKFSADAMVYITSPGTSDITGQAGNFVFQSSQDEIIEGQVVNTSWDDINGAYINIVHNARAVIDMKNLTLTGRAYGDITVIAYDGSQLQGSYHAIIQGKFFLDDTGNPVFYDVTDTGTWDLEGVSGVFEDVHASGNFNVELAPVDGTLGGIMALSGTYK